jgi:hypothetical protein
MREEKGWPGAACGVKAEVIVFLDYSKDFCLCAKAVPSSGLLAVLAGAKSFVGMARSCGKKPDRPRQPRKGERRTRGLLYIFPGAGTLRKNASAN